MIRPHFTLAVVASADGFIAKAPGHGPWEWASAEEQALFFAAVEAADWAIMGCGTHEAADKPERRRIVFSSSAQEAEWRRPAQLWLDPKTALPDDLPALVSHVHPMRNALILGATRVHDWFHRAGRIDEIHLTVEPVRFGSGLPLFTGEAGPAEDVLARNGYWHEASRPLNDRGTRYYRFRRG